MFKNIGKKLQKVSTVVFEIFIIVEVFFTLYILYLMRMQGWLQTLMSAAAQIFWAWLAWAFVYAAAEIVIQITRIADHTAGLPPKPGVEEQKARDEKKRRTKKNTAKW